MSYSMLRDSVDEKRTFVLRTSTRKRRSSSKCSSSPLLDWSQSSPLPGGCLFVQASVELDDRPGSVRERLVGIQRQWPGVIATSLQKGIEAGAFHDGADPEQFAQDVYGVMLAYHHASRLLHDPRAETRARRAFATLLAAARAAH